MKRHEIKDPSDLTGKCPDCDQELEEKQGFGYSYCAKCKVLWEFYIKSVKKI